MQEVISMNFSNFRGDIKFNEPLKYHTSFKIGGNADIIFYPIDERDLIWVMDKIRKEMVRYFVLGSGSNILVHDNGFQGFVICLKHINNIKITKEIQGNRIIIQAEAGANLSKIVNFATFHGLSGMEFAAGIPGTLGGAIIMNSGNKSDAISDVIKSITVMTPNSNFLKLNRNEIGFDYRSTDIPNGYIIINSRMVLKKSNKRKIKSTIKKLIKIRKKIQPHDFPSAGSIFRNPIEDSAGKLIESIGLKGTKIGGAVVSEKHANFIINKDGAKAEDVIQLIELIKKSVYENHNIQLEPEIRIIH